MAGAKYQFDDPEDLKRPNPWVAPEHRRFARGMKRNWNPKRGPIGHLKLDERPEILVPKRQSYADFA